MTLAAAPVFRPLWARDLVPRKCLVGEKVAEDRVHDEVGESTWRRVIFGKSERMWTFEHRDMPRLMAHRPTARFLEVGGGLCYASAVVKLAYPEATVTATDLSLNYLNNHAIRLGVFMGSPVDVYAAADAEDLPFPDESFDAIFSQMLLYRLADPFAALRSIRRVLAPGGIYLGIERASPWCWPWLDRERREMTARNRSRRGETMERPWTRAQWAGLVRPLRPAIRVEWIPGRFPRHAVNVARAAHVALVMERTDGR